MCIHMSVCTGKHYTVDLALGQLGLLDLGGGVGLQVTRYKLQAASCKSQVRSEKLEVRS